MYKKNNIAINGREAVYWEKNQTQERVIVLLHGFPGNHGGLVAMASGLGDYRLILPDLPASGQSKALKDEHIMENYVKWLDVFLEKLSINKTILIGHSFGARLALAYGGEHPDKVEKLVLITPVVKFNRFIAFLASLEYGVAKILPQSLKKTWLANKYYRGAIYNVVFKSASRKRRQQIIDKDMEEMTHLNPRAHVEVFDEFYKSAPISMGEKISIETLIIAGDKDELAPPRSVKKLTGRFYKVDFRVMKNAGHNLVAESPQTTANIIRQWFG